MDGEKKASAAQLAAQRRREQILKKKGDIRGRVDALIAEGNFYEAEQMIEGLVARLSGNKQAEEAAAELIKFIAVFQDGGHCKSAHKLAMLLVKTLETLDVPEKGELVDKLLEIARRMPEENRVDACEFLEAALRWSMKFGPNRLGSPKLHRDIAAIYWKRGEMSLANLHFLRCDAYENHCNMLIEWSNSGFKGETDLFLARVVLQYAALKNLEGANKVFTMFIAAFETLNTPMMNYLKFCMERFCLLFGFSCSYLCLL